MQGLFIWCVMSNESRLSITIDSRSAEQQAKDLETALQALDSAGIRVVNTTDKAGKTATSTGRAFTGAGRDAKQGAGGVDNLNRSLQQTDERASAAAATISRVLKAAIAGFSVMHVIDTADQWGQYASRIKMATNSLDEYEHVQKRMAQSAQLTYRSINETRESFIQLSPVLRDMGLTLDQSIDAVDTFSGLLVVNGASAARSTAAMEALAKSFQRGRAEADAWMTIYSTVDNIVNLLAESSGKTTTEIRKMGIEGKISADMLSKALIDGNQQILKAVEEMPTTVRDALQNLNTAFTEYVGWNNEATGATASLASGIGVLADNFETIASVIGVTAAGALFVYTARTVESTRATIAMFAARTHAAKATLDEAQAQAAQTAATLAQTRAMSGLAATHAQVIAATKAHETALKQLAVAQAGYTRAGTALLGVLGGPVGLGVTAALAAASFLYFRSSADDAAAGSDGLSKSVDELNAKLSTLTQNQARAELLNIQNQAGELNQQFIENTQSIEFLQDRLSRFPNAPHAKTWRDELTMLQGVSDTLRQKIDGLNGAMRSLFGILNAPISQGGDALDKVSDAYKKFETQINRQIALIGKTGRAAQLRYDIEHGELATLVPLEKEKALALVSTLEAREKEEEARRKALADAGKEAKEIDELIKTLREQSAVLGMTEQEAARYRVEAMAGTRAQKDQAIALLDANHAYKENIALTRERLNLESELAVFRAQEFLPITGMGQGIRTREQLEAEYAVREEYANRRRELDEGQESESTRISEDALQRRMRMLAEAEEAKIGIIRDAAARRLVAEQNWITGAQEAMRNYADEAANIYESVNSAVSNAFKGMEESLVQFVRTGKADFKSLADSIINEMIRIQIQQRVTGPLSGFLGNLLGGGSSAPAGVTPGVDWTFPGRRTGGPVSAGKMYEVNEDGIPELLNVGKRQFLMMGSEGGHVTPVGSGSSGGSASGSAAPIVNIYVTESGSKSEAPAGLERFGKDIARYIDGRFRELQVRSIKPGGLAWDSAQGVR